MISTRRIVHLTWLATALAACAVVLAACGGGSDKQSISTPPASAKVNVTLKEWSLTPDTTSVPAGSVTFTATNDGSFEHEMIVIKTGLAPDALPISSGAVDEAAAGNVIDEIPEFAPGATQTLTVDLGPGAYVLFCNVGGHYQQGVRSAFTVTAAASTGGRYY